MSRRTICETALLGCRGEDDEDIELAEMSDDGIAVERQCDEIDHRCFGTGKLDEGYYRRMERKARDFVRWRDSSLLPTLNAILRNGSNRRESIFELAKSKMPTAKQLNAAEKKYYRNRAKLLQLFNRYHIAAQSE
jgi:hypothetical protein